MKITINDKTAAEAKELLDELGMDIRTAVNVFLRQMIRERGLPFFVEVRRKSAKIDDDDDDHFYSEANMEHLRKSIAQLESGQVIEHELVNA